MSDKDRWDGYEEEKKIYKRAKEIWEKVSIISDDVDKEDALKSEQKTTDLVDIVDNKIKDKKKKKRMLDAFGDFRRKYETCENCGHRYTGSFKSYCGICEECGSNDWKERFKSSGEQCINEISEIYSLTFEVAKKIFGYGLDKLRGY